MSRIILEHVTKQIKGKTIIKDISMELDPGRVIGLKGINGSGKTMLMRLMSGLIYATQGQVKINGKILAKEIEFPESIGILIESPALLDSYSGFKNLKILSSIKKCVTDKDIIKVIQKVGLEPEDKKKYKKYSLGMKQRLGIAAAILENPEILLLDEPTNALDSAGIDMLKKLVIEEKSKGTLIVLSCHDSNILKELSDEIYVIEDGKIAEHLQITQTKLQGLIGGS